MCAPGVRLSTTSDWVWSGGSTARIGSPPISSGETEGQGVFQALQLATPVLGDPAAGGAAVRIAGIEVFPGMHMGI